MLKIVDRFFDEIEGFKIAIFTLREGDLWYATAQILIPLEFPPPSFATNTPYTSKDEVKAAIKNQVKIYLQEKKRGLSEERLPG